MRGEGIGLCWSRLWSCIIGMRRCNRDVLVGVVVGEDIGSGVGSHYSLDADVC